MKIRTGFVSNSSSSSFTCDITGTVASSPSGEYYDECMCSCSKEHGFLEKFLLKNKTPKTVEDKKDALEIFVNYGENEIEEDELEKYFPWDKKKALTDAVVEVLFEKYKKQILLSLTNNPEEGMIWYVPSFMCPLCNFKKISKNDLIRFLLLEKYGKKASLKMIEKDIMKKYADFSTFQKDIAGIKLGE